MMNEHELLEYNDVLVDFANLVHRYGVRRVLIDFQTHYPDFLEEVRVQVNRLPQKPIAALLRK